MPSLKSLFLWFESGSWSWRASILNRAGNLPCHFSSGIIAADICCSFISSVGRLCVDYSDCHHITRAIYDLRSSYLQRLSMDDSRDVWHSFWILTSWPLCAVLSAAALNIKWVSPFGWCSVTFDKQKMFACGRQVNSNRVVSRFRILSSPSSLTT